MNIPEQIPDRDLADWLVDLYKLYDQHPEIRDSTNRLIDDVEEILKQR